MIRNTSVEAYNKIKDEGLLSRRRLQVYDVLYKHGPLTATGITNLIPGFKSSSVGFNVHARLCEMREMGCVEELGTKICSITGMTVILWDVTKEVPVKIKREPRQKCLFCNGKGFTYG